MTAKVPAVSCSSSSSSTLSSYRSAVSSVASATSGGGEKNHGDDNVFLPTKGTVDTLLVDLTVTKYAQYRSSLQNSRIKINVFA